MTAVIFHDFLIYILIGFIVYIIDLAKSVGLYKYCYVNPLFHLNLLIHHIISVFILFGWLSNNKYILILYVIVCMSTGIGWAVFKSCLLTDLNNYICKLPKKTEFNNILNLLQIKKLKHSTEYQSFYMVFTAVISLMRIRFIK